MKQIEESIGFTLGYDVRQQIFWPQYPEVDSERYNEFRLNPIFGELLKLGWAELDAWFNWK